MSGLLINGLSTREGRRPTHECRYRSCSSLSGFSRGAVLVYRHALVALRHRIREFLSIRQDACQSWTADSCIGRGDRQKRNLRVGWEGDSPGCDADTRELVCDFCGSRNGRVRCIMSSFLVSRGIREADEAHVPVLYPRSARNQIRPSSYTEIRA